MGSLGREDKDLRGQTQEQLPEHKRSGEVARLLFPPGQDRSWNRKGYQVKTKET